MKFAWQGWGMPSSCIQICRWVLMHPRPTGRKGLLLLPYASIGIHACCGFKYFWEDRHTTVMMQTCIHHDCFNFVAMLIALIIQASLVHITNPTSYREVSCFYVELCGCFQSSVIFNSTWQQDWATSPVPLTGYRINRRRKAILADHATRFVTVSQIMPQDLVLMLVQPELRQSNRYPVRIHL